MTRRWPNDVSRKPGPGPVEVARRVATRLTQRIHALPVLVLMPHSRCNCRCVMCDIWKANHERRELTRDDLAPHLAAIRRLGVRRVVLSGGEALLHSNLWTLVEALAEQDVRITLLSTGLLLRRHAAGVARWCDEVIVSLDGPREVHDQIRRVPGAYDRLAEGIMAVRSVAPGLRVVARCVVQRRNFRELAQIVAAAAELGCDQVSFLAVDVSTTAFNRPTPWESQRIADVALAPDEVAAFERIVEETIVQHAAAFASGFVAESPEKLRRLVHYFAALNGAGPFPETTCNAPWVSAVVEADGTVRPCFFHRALGNLRDGTLDAILNHPAAIAFRRDLDVRTNPICRRCVCTLNLGAREPV